MKGKGFKVINLFPIQTHQSCETNGLEWNSSAVQAYCHCSSVHLHQTGQFPLLMSFLTS